MMRMRNWVIMPLIVVYDNKYYKYEANEDYSITNHSLSEQDLKVMSRPWRCCVSLKGSLTSRIWG